MNADAILTVQVTHMHTCLQGQSIMRRASASIGCIAQHTKSCSALVKRHTCPHDRLTPAPYFFSHLGGFSKLRLSVVPALTAQPLVKRSFLGCNVNVRFINSYRLTGYHQTDVGLRLECGHRPIFRAMSRPQEAFWRRRRRLFKNRGRRVYAYQS